MFSHRLNNNLIIKHTKKMYAATPGGYFQKKPYKEYTETVNGVFYENFIKSVSFFNGFGGGTCRAYWNYTSAGYIPDRVVTISPDRSVKHIDTFTFKFIY